RVIWQADRGAEAGATTAFLAAAGRSRPNRLLGPAGPGRDAGLAGPGAGVRAAPVPAGRVAPGPAVAGAEPAMGLAAGRRGRRPPAAHRGRRPAPARHHLPCRRLRALADLRPGGVPAARADAAAGPVLADPDAAAPAGRGAGRGRHLAGV